MSLGQESSGKLKPIKIGLPGEEIGKKELVAVARRFQNLHALQLQRIQDSLSPRQRDFLELLPLLFHTNHPLLPGFVSLETPAGIPDYQPARRTLMRAERLTKSFEYRRRALAEYPVWGVYLMGSVGSIAYSNKSDLDIWLCHDPDLDPEGLRELKEKAVAIEQWAQSLKLEAHIFFINPDDFRRGVGQPISTESCGSIQHHLLLEEFYRTSLYLAGRIPAWWLVPPDQDVTYTAYLRHLRDNRFVNEADLIDFGGLEFVSAEEFLGGTLWHLYKAIGAPHKSLLKLLLMESYAAEYPRPAWLCTELKSAVYQGSVDIHELDSYLLMYRKVESYLAGRQEHARLDLARQCFYLKINELLSVRSSPANERWERREILSLMTRIWGWGGSRLTELDARRRWRVEKAIEAQKPINRELNHAYQSVSRFAREYANQMTLRNDELALLGRRLYAALERKPGKVELLSRDGYEDIAEQDFSLHRAQLTDGAGGWALYAEKAGPDVLDRVQPLKRAHSLIEILAWLICNGFYRRKTQQIFLEPGDTSLTANELKNTLGALEQFLRGRLRDEEQLEAFGRPSLITAAALFVNLGSDPDAVRKDGMQVTSNRFDPLSFGANRANQVLSVDRIALTSWRETQVGRHRGPACLFDVLCELLNGLCPAEIDCFCFGSARSRSFTVRVTRLYQRLSEVFGGDRLDPVRFVIRGGNEFFVLARAGGAVRYSVMADEAALLAELATPRLRYGIVAFDEAAFENSPLPELYRHSQTGVVQLFCHSTAQATDLYVLDERGSLYYRRHGRCSPQQLLAPYAVFLGATQRHCVTGLHDFQYYVLHTLSEGRFETAPFAVKAEPETRKLNIRIFGQDLGAGRVAYVIQCNDQEFSSMESGPEVFAEVADHILRLRQSGENYPIYISDVDVPPAILGCDALPQLQTVHLLNYKQKIEERLNA
ncbi:MAG: class I adenylate cyclase [Methylococcaceae bacterium]|nr:class I adenylate cyclase [Methylococcaceae bacterium]